MKDFSDMAGAKAVKTVIRAALAAALFPACAFAATVTINPNAAGTNSAWTWTGGSANYTNWLTADDEDTTYAVASNKNLVQTVNLQDTALSGVINSVTVHVRYREASAIELFDVVLKDSVGTYTSADKTGTASYAQYSEARTTRSNGTAWTWADINALEAGVKSIASGGWGGAPRVTTLYAVVDYTPNVAPSVTLDNDFAALSSGTIRINYKMIDPNADTTNLTNNGALAGVEWSSDGSTWGSDAAMGTGGDGSTGLTSAASPGTAHKFAWDSATDLAGVEDSTVYVRLAPNDGYVDGSWVVSSAFAVDNKAPVNSLAAHFETSPVSGGQAQVDAAFTEGNPNTNIYAYDLGAGYVTGAGDANVQDPSPLSFGAALTGADKFTAIKCTHTDDIGNATVSEVIADVYVRPLTPNAPSLANPGQTTAQVTMNNPADGAGMYYVIRATSTGGTSYVQTDGSLGGSPAWYAGWSTPVNVTGLTGSIEYWFSVAAGNPQAPTPSEGENSASPYGVSANISTLAPPPMNMTLDGGLTVEGLALGN